MKKFISSKINKPQWRITVPNINSNIFRKSPTRDDTTSKRSSGFYDFQEAQQEYDHSRSLPNSVYIDSASTSSGEFQDASDKRHSSDTDIENFQDVIVTKIVSKNIDDNNSQYEYDVPRISFKFFAEDKIDKESIKSEKNDEVPQEDGNKKETNEVYDLPPSHPSEKFVSQTEIYIQSLESIPLSIKSASSDPNIQKTLLENDEDNFYQVPRPLKVTNRLSQSLKDFNKDLSIDSPVIIDSNHSSIEHLSASQVIAEISKDDDIDKPIKTKKIKKSKKWDSFKVKFNNLMQEQASKQRVGAFTDKDKISINFEEMYKNSKSKCRKVIENTKSRMFKKKVDVDGAEDQTVRKVTKDDIEYRLNISNGNEEEGGDNLDESKSSNNTFVSSVKSADEFKNGEFDFSALKNAFRKRILSNEGQNGFEDLRRYVKQGGDFCKELSQILQERAEAESQYAKSLSKLSTKLSRACRENVGGLNEAWKAVALELETKAEAHRLLGTALLEETAKPLKSLTESQHRIRKQAETQVDKAAKLLAEWRATEAKGKKNSHSCARENEKLQDAAILDTNKYGKQSISKSSSLIQLAQIKQSNNDTTKLEGKKKKAEDAVKKADVEYYSLCVRAERARLEWETAVLRGASAFQALEEERLNNLKSVLNSYLHHNTYIGPRLLEASERLKGPIQQAEPCKDLVTFQNLRQGSQQVSEQLLPDFYCEHITLAMNRERRKQALLKLLQLIRQDIEREKKSKIGLENLSKAIKQTPSFGSEDSQQSVVEKLYHMKSMLAYLEGAKYKVQSALAELEGTPRSSHPLSPHITITRDKSGLQQSILKVPQWLKDEWGESDRSPVSQKSSKSSRSDNSDPHNNDVEDHDWLDRGAADGNSNQPDSDFDEFSSNCSSTGDNMCGTDEPPLHPIATCRAIYTYTPNMHDELLIKIGDIISVYRQQDDGWWLGECNGNVGIFPATYVELVQNT